MAERIVTARHRQVCDLCKRPIEAGERCRLIRDDLTAAENGGEVISPCYEMSYEAQ